MLLILGQKRPDSGMAVYDTLLELYLRSEDVDSSEKEKKSLKH